MHSAHLARLLPVVALLLGLSAHLAAAQTWEEITPNVPGRLTDGNIMPMASDGTRLYVLGETGVYVSADDGQSFTAINSLPGEPYDLDVLQFTFIKYVNGIVWAGGLRVTQPGLGAIDRLYRLTPGATAWQKSGAGIPADSPAGTADDIAFDPASGAYFVGAGVGGVYVSTDGGFTWERRDGGLGGVGLPASVATLDGTAFAARPLGGVFSSTDQGAEWTPALAISDAPGNLIVHDGRLLMLSVGTDFFVSDDGATWDRIAGVPHGVSRLSSDGSTVYAVSYSNRAFQNLAASTTDGQSWELLPRAGLPPIPTFAGYEVRNLLPHRGYLFLHGVTLDDSFQWVDSPLHRLAVGAPPAACVGDCNGDGTVTVNEVILGIGIALGNLPLAECLTFDTSGDGTVSIDEIVQAIGYALNACP